MKEFHTLVGPNVAPDVAAPPERSLSRHDFLYAGEWQHESFQDQRIHLIRRGRQEWSWVMPWEGEFGDVTLLPSGQILFAWYGGIALVSRRGDVVWKWDAPEGTEVHTCQPLRAGRVLVVANGSPALALVLRMSDRTVEWSGILPAGGGHRHAMFRHCRMTKCNELVVGHLDMDRVVRYDLSMHPILVIETETPWAAVPLDSGGYLVSGDSAAYVSEFDALGRRTWSFNKQDAKSWGLDVFAVQQAQRLSNGNTLFTNWSGNHRSEGEREGTVQVIEVTKYGQVAWALSQWTDPNLGVASNIQILAGASDEFEMIDR